MGTITLKNLRTTADVKMNTTLKDGGIYIDWASLSDIKAWLWSDTQRALAGRCDVRVDANVSTKLICEYASTKPQYPGVNRLIVQASYMGATKTYDKPAFNFVRWTGDQSGQQVTIDDPEVNVDMEVTDVTSSILQEAIAAALAAAERAEAAAEEAEHMIEIKTGPAGKSAYEVAVENGYVGTEQQWLASLHGADGTDGTDGKSAYEIAVEDGFVGTEEQWLASLKGPVGETPDISIGTVTTVEPGQPAGASMGGTPEAPVLNLSIPQGQVGATPNFTIGTVTTGQPGTPVVITITGTAEAPVLNIQIPQGMKGDTGVSADYPITIHNGLDSDATDEALAAFQGKVLDGKVSQLEAKVSGNLMSTRAKNALLAVFNKVAFAVPDVSAEMSELNIALFNLDEIVGISATYTQTKTIWSDGVSVLNDLKTDLIVKAIYGDGTEVAVTNYTISGTLTTGTSVITVEYEGLTTTFNVTVTEYGSKMTYTMAEGTVINKQGRISDYSVGSYQATGVNNYGVSTETTRRVFITNFGKTKLKNYPGTAFIDAYPIKIPSTASKAIITISGSSQQVAARVLKLVNGEYLRGEAGDFPYVNMSYTTGGGTLNFPDMGIGEFYLLLWGQRVNSASYAGNEPTAITVTFE